MKITSKGQVTIPIEVLEKMGFFPNSKVEFVIQGDVVILHKATGSKGRGQKVIERMRGRKTGVRSQLLT